MALLKKITNVAITGAGQHIIASASWIFLMRIVADYGTDAVNGYGLAIRIIIFTILPAWGIANAAATLIGQNLGAKQIERAEKSVWIAVKFNALFLLCVSVVYFIWAEPLIRLFNGDVGVVTVGVECLRIFSISYFSYGVAMVINQAFGGAGDTRTPTLINLFSFWVLQIPLAYLLAKIAGWGPTGVYWAVVISESIMAIICIVWFKKGRWKTVEI